jgi:hypothetical protein
LLVGVELAETALESLLALVGALFEARKLGPAFANFSLSLVSPSSRVLFCGEEHGFRFLFGDAHLIEASFGIRVVLALHLGNASTRIHNGCGRKRGCNNHQPDKGDDLD